jgi:hypothetical protein
MEWNGMICYQATGGFQSNADVTDETALNVMWVMDRAVRRQH